MRPASQDKDWHDEVDEDPVTDDYDYWDDRDFENSDLPLDALKDFYAQCPIEPPPQDLTAARRASALDLLGRTPTYALRIFRLPNSGERFSYVVTEGRPLMPDELLDAYGPGTYRLCAMSSWPQDGDLVRDSIYVEVEDNGTWRIYRLAVG